MFSITEFCVGNVYCYCIIHIHCVQFLTFVQMMKLPKLTTCTFVIQYAYIVHTRSVIHISDKKTPVN